MALKSLLLRLENENKQVCFRFTRLAGSDDATGTAKNRRAEKIAGYSVRCTKIE